MITFVVSWINTGRNFESNKLKNTEKKRGQCSGPPLNRSTSGSLRQACHRLRKNMERHRNKSPYIQDDSPKPLMFTEDPETSTAPCINSAFVPLFYSVDQLIMALFLGDFVISFFATDIMVCLFCCWCTEAKESDICSTMLVLKKPVLGTSLHCP